MSVDRESLVGMRLGLILVGTDADGNEELRDRLGVVSLEDETLVLTGDGIRLEIQPDWLELIQPAKPGAEPNIDYLLVLTAGRLPYSEGFKNVDVVDPDD